MYCDVIFALNPLLCLLYNAASLCSCSMWEVFVSFPLRLYLQNQSDNAETVKTYRYLKPELPPKSLF